ncbi:putative F-box protein At1g47790 [Lactuca sativa]|nr:putative F-box protein At1g47790 [Lactuca sativa]
MKSAHLCDELIVEIFTRLPSKSLLRFRSLSKSCYSCIGSPDFIRMHTSQSQQKLLIRHRAHKENKEGELEEFYTLHPQDQLSLSYKHGYNNITPVQFPSTYSNIIGSYNGLVCLFDYDEKSIILWNPSIRRKLTLPDCPRTCYSEVEIGFGFDPVIDDYKIVCMPVSNGKKAGRFFVYALKTNIWRRIASHTPLFSSVITKPCLFNGVLYWLGHYDLTRTYYLLTFDLSTHVFGSIALPFKTVLSVAPTPIQGSIPSLANFANQIWLMKDASWSAFLNFKKDQVMAHLSSVLQLSTSDDLVFYSFCNGFQVYNLKIGEFSRLVNFNGASFVFDVIQCLESLQLLGMGTACEGNKLIFS